jgi:hypothetical protein
MGDNYNLRLLREMCRIDGFNPAVNAYVNRYSFRTNRDQMHMAFFMVDHEKIDPTKYRDVFSIPSMSDHMVLNSSVNRCRGSIFQW